MCGPYHVFGSFLAWAVGLMGAMAVAQDAPGPATTQAGAEVAVRIEEAHIKREAHEQRGTYPGTAQLELVLLLQNAVILPLAQNAISIEAFVDDTHQTLLRDDQPSPYSVQNARVSPDGKTVTLRIVGSTGPSEQSGRVYLRGAVSARRVTGEPMVESARLALRVGEEVTVGPFKTRVGSASSESSRMLLLALRVDGDVARIRKVRVLSADGRQLNDERQTTQFTDYGGGPIDRPSTLHILLTDTPRDPVTLEYSIVQTEPVRIPFEAQVDIGVTQGGSIEPAAEAVPVPRDAQRRPQVPARRPRFDPTTQLAQERARIERAAVDIFSLTIGKAAPGEVEGVSWANPPATAFRASGFTLVRLMLSIPEVQIIRIPPEGISITRFEDDKGGELDTTHDTAPNAAYGYPVGAYPSPGREQTLVTVSLRATPRPGATRCTLAGFIKAEIGKSQRTTASDPIPLAKQQTFKAGAFQGNFTQVRQTPPIGPDPIPGGGVEVFLRLSGSLDLVYNVAIFDAQTQERLAVQTIHRSNFVTENVISTALVLHKMPADRVIVRVGHFEATETVEIPFQITTTLGL